MGQMKIYLQNHVKLYNLAIMQSHHLIAVLEKELFKTQHIKSTSNVNLNIMNFILNALYHLVVKHM